MADITLKHADREMTTVIQEADRQLILLALATLAKQRPGFEHTLNQLALHFDGPYPIVPELGGTKAEMFNEFLRMMRDEPEPAPSPPTHPITTVPITDLKDNEPG